MTGYDSSGWDWNPNQPTPTPAPLTPHQLRQIADFLADLLDTNARTIETANVARAFRGPVDAAGAGGPVEAAVMCGHCGAVARGGWLPPPGRSVERLSGCPLGVVPGDPVSGVPGPSQPHTDAAGVGS